MYFFKGALLLGALFFTVQQDFAQTKMHTGNSVVQMRGKSIPKKTDGSVPDKSDKLTLLKNVPFIPLPDTPVLVSATYAIGERPEIIAMAKGEKDKSYRYASIVTSRLGKGKIIVFGSADYLQKPFTGRPEIAQLLKNTLAWGGGKGNEMILTDDVTDSFQLAKIETFIRAGGTLIFGSPLYSIFKRITNGDFYQLNLNKLLVKAGLFTVYNPPSPLAGNRLLIDSVPSYLHYSLIMNMIEAKRLLQIANGTERDILTAILSLAISFRLDSPEVKRIMQAFPFSPDSLIVPSADHPLWKKNTASYMTYYFQQVLLSAMHDKHPDTGYIAAASRLFPGEVSATAQRTHEDIIIPLQTGTQGLLEPDPVYYRWHSTGLYVPAGEKVIVTISSGDTSLRLKAQIGVHNDDLRHMDKLTREGFDLTSKFELGNTVTTIFSPYGGILMINVPDTSNRSSISIHVDGAVKYPRFQLGITSLADWQQTIRNYHAPWAELATDKIILTVPSYRIRQLDDPEKLMKFWDEVMDADARLASISTTRKHPERIIVDQDVAWGYMFTEPYKIVVPDDESCGWMLDEAYMRAHGSWGHFHELGHRHQFWGLDFEALGEVTENLYSMYVYDKVLHKGIYNHEAIASRQVVHDRIMKYMAGDPSFEKWSGDAFTALCMYIELIEAFGWKPIEQIFADYRTIPKDKYPSADTDRIDLWYSKICNATGKDMSAFFAKWKVPVSGGVVKTIAAKGYPGWMPAELQ